MSKRERDPESPTNVKKQKIDSNSEEWSDCLKPQLKKIQKNNSLISSEPEEIDPQEDSDIESNIAEIALSMSLGDPVLASRRVFEAMHFEITEMIDRGVLITPTLISETYNLTIYEAKQIMGVLTSDSNNRIQTEILYRFVIHGTAKIFVLVGDSTNVLPPGKVLSKEIFGFCKAGAKSGALATYQPRSVEKRNAMSINSNRSELINLTKFSHKREWPVQKVDLFYFKDSNPTEREDDDLRQVSDDSSGDNSIDHLDTMVAEMTDETIIYNSQKTPVRSPSDDLSSEKTPSSHDLSITSPYMTSILNLSSPDSLYLFFYKYLLLECEVKCPEPE